MKQITFVYPWEVEPLDEYDIGVMNHYHVNRNRHLFILMTHKNGTYLKAEGINETKVWQSLIEQANDIKSFAEAKLIENHKVIKVTYQKARLIGQTNSRMDGVPCGGFFTVQEPANSA
jgi:hypothetical protein